MFIVQPNIHIFSHDVDNNNFDDDNQDDNAQDDNGHGYDNDCYITFVSNFVYTNYSRG